MRISFTAAGYLYEEDPVAKWQEMAAWQEKWASYLDGKKELHILSKDTDIFVNVAAENGLTAAGMPISLTVKFLPLLWRMGLTAISPFPIPPS